MKKLVTFLLILVLVALSAPALAANTDGLGDTVTRNAELAAFLDGNGRIYVSGLERPVNVTPADSLVSIDPYRILFFAQPNATTGVPQGRLISLELNGLYQSLSGFNTSLSAATETVVTDDAYAACLDEENVYYISASNRGQLIRYNLDDKTSGVAFTANESLDRVYDSSIGIVTTLVDGAGAYISDPITGQFVTYDGDAAREIAAGDGFEAYLTDSANLFVRVNGALTPALVDTSVRAWAIVGRNIYYLSGSEGALSLKQYLVDSNIWNFVLTMPTDIEPQLTASENSLFVLSRDNIIYSVDVSGKRLVSYATLPSPQSYALGGTKQLTGYRIEAVSGQLNLYGTVTDTNATPTFTFVDFGGASTLQSKGAGDLLLSAYAIDAESTVWDLLQPAPQYSPLRRGSRGDAVSAIQQPLYDKGYYNYYIDGIFGWRTERAVELLQDALGLYVNGVADEALQRTILTTDIPAYDPYRGLSRGDTGLRVTEMQQRLRDLGYLADDADGIFGVRTLAAVELFQSENGLSATGVADNDTLRKLYSQSARSCSSYIDLRRGDSGYRVRELNRRLKELYYLEGGVGSSYTAATQEAVRRFQREAGLSVTGEATGAVQRVLFGRNAPEYSGYITLQRGDDNSRVLEMQRRLRDLGYYTNGLDGYFGKGTYQAVRAFQRQAGLKVTGIADPTTLKELYASDAPEYQKPIEMTKPVIDLIGIFDPDEDGVYQIPVETPSFKAYWTAEGVKSYDVTLTTGKSTYNLLKGTTDEEIELLTNDMKLDAVYTLTVTAHPQDSVNNKDASASLSFRIVPKPTTLESVVIEITGEGNHTYNEDEEIYEIEPDALKFAWAANGGEVSRYAYSLTAEGSDAAVVSGEGKDATSVDLTQSELSADVVYTLAVSAYPEGNDEGVVSAELRFRVVEPEVVATPAPTDTPKPTDTPEPTDTPAPEETAAPGETETAGPNGEQNGEQDGANGTEGEGSTLGVPVIEFQPVAGTTSIDVVLADGSTATEEVTLVTEDTLTLSWPAEGEVSKYTVNISDLAGNLMVEQDIESSYAQLPSSNLVPGTVYELTATAIAATGETSSSSAYFMLPAPEADEQIGEGEPEADEQDGEGEPEADEQDGEGEPEADEQSGEDEPEADEQTGEGEPETNESEPQTMGNEPVVGMPVTGVPSVDVLVEDEPYADDPSDDLASNVAGQPMISITPFSGVTEDGVVLVEQGTLDLSWTAEGDVTGYNVRITDEAGNVMVDQGLSNAGAQLGTDNLTPNVTYTLSVTANFSDGQTTEASCAFRCPVEEQPEAEEPYVEEPVVDEPYVEEPYVEEPYVEEPVADEPYVEEPVVDEPYVEEPVVEEPLVLGDPRLMIEPNEGYDGDTILVAEGTLVLSWPAEGEVVSYDVRITDGSGNPVVEQNMSDASAQIPSDNLTPNAVYTLSVTANFASGDTTFAQLSFTRRVEQQPEVEEPYVEEPYVEEPYVEEPYVEEPYVEEPYVEEPYVEEPYVEEPYVEPEPEPEPAPEPEPEPEPADPYPMDDPSAWNFDVDANSDPEAIAVIQKRLKDWGWLSGDCSKGSLDDATVQAIIDFQSYMNENGESLSVTDPSNPKIGRDTLALLFNAYGDSYRR